MNERFEKHIRAIDSGQTALDLLAGNTSLTKRQLKAAMSNGAVWLESRHGIRRIRRAKKSMAPSDTLHLYYDSQIQAQAPGGAVLVADEGDYSVWNKPCGMYSQGTKWGDHCTIYRWAETHLEPQRPAYLVHRLDRAANGLILLAHNKSTARAFLHMFEHRSITKRYRVAVKGDASRLRLPFVIDQQLDGKQALSVILTADYDAAAHQTTVLIDIQSGRKHQIRRHLASIGHPVVGDRLYGSAETGEDLQLSAVFLGFTCPITNCPRSYSLDDSPAVA